MTAKEKMMAVMTNGLQSDFPGGILGQSAFLRDHWSAITDRPWWAIYCASLDNRLNAEEDSHVLKVILFHRNYSAVS